MSRSLNCQESRVMELPECSLVSEKWKSLDPDILREILSRVPIDDLFLNVSSVCLAWRAACWDYLFWSRSVLDLSGTGAAHGIVDSSTVVSLRLAKSNRAPGFLEGKDLPKNCNQMGMSLMRKLQHILEGGSMCPYSLQSWRLNVQTVIVPYDLEISDAHLVYIAERTPHVKELLLLGAHNITAAGFMKAIQSWKYAKEIHLGPHNDDRSARFIKEIGRSCEKLEVLHVYLPGFVIDKNNMLVISKNLAGLKKLGFQCGYIFPSGVEILFKMCIQLEEVYFKECRRTHCYEPKRGFEYSSCHSDSFRLYWTVDKKGYAKWEVKPDPVECEPALDPAFYQCRDSDLQKEFDVWMLTYTGKPRRQPLQQHRQTGRSWNTAGLWLETYSLSNLEQ